MPNFAEDMMRQAAHTADYYLDRGRDYIAGAFNVEPNSPEHIDLCKSLLPAYLDACAADYAMAMNPNRREV